MKGKTIADSKPLNKEDFVEAIGTARDQRIDMCRESGKRLSSCPILRQQ
jgi:hypothetical protein